MRYLERETAAGPKRLPALDGGGIRGHLTLQVLAALEDLLREQSGAGQCHSREVQRPFAT
ncbi:MAG: hypothetical protein M3Q31_16440 [Actinomycetota bacterium]|nr:hypothetical protein [Actinomycetota bacterium]